MRDENAIFEEYRTAEGNHKEELSVELARALMAHAMAVCWIQLHEQRADIANFCVAKAFAKLERFRGDAKFSTWFHRIVVNACNSRLRDKFREAHERNIDDVMGTEPALMVQPSQLDAKLELERVVSKLPPDDKEFVEWKLGGVSDEDIDRRRGMKAGWARLRWHRIRKRILRQML